MIVDSLRYWDSQMHVDGFRFDLASVFTRRSDGSINLHDPPIINLIGTDVGFERQPLDRRAMGCEWRSLSSDRKFPGQRWMQWNSLYRDIVQRFVRGDAGLVPDLMTRLYGSCDLFPDDLSQCLATLAQRQLHHLA